MAYTGTLRQIDEINRQIKKLTHKKTKLMEQANLNEGDLRR